MTKPQQYSYMNYYCNTALVRSVLRGRQALGLTFRGSAYCQLIREANKQKRLDWVQKHLRDNFQNVIWTDEASIQLETHHKRCYRKKGETPKPKPRPKHPVKVHVWGGISMLPLVIFTGIMTADSFVFRIERRTPALHLPEVSEPRAQICAG